MAAGDTSYFTHTDADAVAGSMPGLASYNAAASDVKDAALFLASLRLDESRRWQGRKYDPLQVLEFPRVAYSSANPQQQSIGMATIGIGDTIWDWDPATNAAVVPPKVKLAVLFEADSIISGRREQLRQALADGLTAQAIGSASETYGNVSAIGVPVLCAAADVLVRRYVLRSGQMR